MHIPKVVILTPIFGLVLLFTACQGNSTDKSSSETSISTASPPVQTTVITPQSTEAVVSTTQTLTSTSPTAPSTSFNTPTISPPPTSTKTVEPTAESVVPTNTADQAADNPQQFCTYTQTILNPREAFDIIALFQVDFMGENALSVSGVIDQTNPTEYIKGYFDLDTLESHISDTTFESLLSSPCPDGCQTNIIGQSPNGSWQLVQIIGSSEELTGLWLISQTTQLRIIDVNWVKPIWRWADDSSMLWIDYSVFEYVGEYIWPPVLFNLEETPTVTSIRESEIELLETENFYVAFSPPQKTALSVVADEQLMPESAEVLYTFDFTVDINQPISQEHIPGLKKAEWNEPTQDFLLIIKEENSIRISNLDGTRSVQVPLGAFPIETWIVEENVPFSHHALSASGERLAINIGGDGRIFLFNCLG